MSSLGDEPEGRRFPNMVSLVRYQVWSDGVDQIASQAGGITTAKARFAARVLAREGLVTIEETGDLLIIRPVPGTRLDRRAFPEAPEDVDAHV